MNSIVPGWTFYMIEVLGSLEKVTLVIMVVAAMGAAIIATGFAIEAVAGNTEALLKISKYVKRYFILIIALLLLYIAVPSKNTMYMILANQYITEENLQKVGGTPKDVIDYIFEKLGELQD